MIVGIETSKDLQLANWRPKRASGVGEMQPKSRGLRTGKTDDVGSSLRAGGDCRHSSGRRAGGVPLT